MRKKAPPLTEAVAQFLTWYQSEHPHGINKWSQCIMRSFTYFFTVESPRTLSDINPADMENLKVWRRETNGVGSNTLRKNLLMFRHFNRYAQKFGWTSCDWFASVKIPAEQGSDAMHVLTAEEETAYFKAMASLDPVANDILRVLIQQGCRPAEVMGLQCKNVDLTRRTFTVWDSSLEGKTKKAHRTLTMSTETYNIFQRRLFAPGSPWVFPSPKKVGPRTTIQKKHEAAVKLSGVECRPYDMRHTFATRFLRREGGANSIPALKEILGHTEIAMLDQYVHFSQQDMDDAMLRFDKAQQKTKRIAEQKARKESSSVMVQ